jgi:uncharacterized protein (TIGR03435 family)
VAVAGPLAFGLLNAPLLRAQSSAPDWQTAAGGKISFDVASVKQNKSGPPPSGDKVNSNFSLGPSDFYSANGGLFSATNLPIANYIGFAYKLMGNQTQSLESQLPKSISKARFDIQAHAPGNTTKDQMRLMMQSLLTDRFKMAVHTEKQELPIYALVLDKPRKTGPQLRPHSDDPPCSAFTLSPSARFADGSPAACGVFLTLLETRRAHTSARNVTLSLIAGSLPFPGMGAFDRLVVDKTGLGGDFDLTLEWTPEGAPATNAQADESGPTYLEALKDQLGLKLESTTGPVDVLIIDHVEEPSPN